MAQQAPILGWGGIEFDGFTLTLTTGNPAQRANSLITLVNGTDDATIITQQHVNAPRVAIGSMPSAQLDTDHASLPIENLDTTDVIGNLSPQGRIATTVTPYTVRPLAIVKVGTYAPTVRTLRNDMLDSFASGDKIVNDDVIARNVALDMMRTVRVIPCFPHKRPGLLQPQGHYRSYNRAREPSENDCIKLDVFEALNGALTRPANTLGSWNLV
jgi:hypothetical protein